MGNVKVVSDQNYQTEVLEAKTPVLVDFWAPWCGPCRMVGPVVEQISEEENDLKVVKVNVDDNPQTALQYGIQSIPTLLVVKDGVVVEQLVGAVPKSVIMEAVRPHLN